MLHVYDVIYRRYVRLGEQLNMQVILVEVLYKMRTSVYNAQVLLINDSDHAKCCGLN